MMVYLVIIPAAIILGLNIISYIVVLKTYLTRKNTVKSVRNKDVFLDFVT